MASSDKSNKRIINYYESTYFDYVVGIKLRRHLGVHYGYWDDSVHNNAQAVSNLNKVLASKLDIKPGMKVLDAGCGVGGSSIWLASNYDVHVTGITLSPTQVHRAKKFARRKDLKQSTNFLVGDYHNTGFGDEEFDIVWGLESICYSEDKPEFLKEAFRVLRPGGQLVIADGFALKESFIESESRMIKKWLDGWAVSSLANFDMFSKQITVAGFESVKSQNVTKNVLRFSKWLHDRAKFARPIGKLLKLLKIRSGAQDKNVDSAILQYQCIKKGLAGYGIFTARKPK